MRLPLRFPLGLVDVAGESMAPTLGAGDTVLVRWGARPRAGSVVVARWPGHGDVLVVKRALRYEGELWWLEGDNAGASEDSRVRGGVPASALRGRVLLRVRRRHG